MIDYENLGKANEEFFSEYKEAFNHTLESGWYILGKEVDTFEKAFASYCGVKHCVGVASGLDALMLSLKAMDYPQGSEVLVPSNTYIATILAIKQASLTPVLVEPDINTYNINASLIEKSITEKTRAIMCVHLYGKICDMDAISVVASKHSLDIFEDCAQSHGASLNGKRAGSFGVGCFSFYPTKNLGALGDGGAVTTDDEEFAIKIKTLRNYGSKLKYYNEVLGYNSRLDEVQASLLNVKLKYLDKITTHKRMLADIYHEGIDSRFIKPVRQEGYFDVFHIYNIRHEKRDALKEYLLAKGIKTDIHYPVSPNKQEAMKGVLEGDFPVSEEIHATTLSLPISYCHTKEDIEKVVEAVNSFKG